MPAAADVDGRRFSSSSVGEVEVLAGFGPPTPEGVDPADAVLGGVRPVLPLLPPVLFLSLEEEDEEDGAGLAVVAAAARYFSFSLGFWEEEVKEEDEGWEFPLPC